MKKHCLPLLSSFTKTIHLRIIIQGTKYVSLYLKTTSKGVQNIIR